MSEPKSDPTAVEGSANDRTEDLDVVRKDRTEDLDVVLKDRTEDLDVVLKEWRQLSRPLEAVVKARSGAADGLDDLQKALSKLPAGGDFQRDLDDLRKKTEQALRLERKAREDRFKRIEAELIRDLRASHIPHKELEKAWRIESVELEVRREQAQARALYNREEIVPWSSVGSTDRLVDLLGRAKRTLEQVEIPESLLVEALWDAREALQRRSKSPRLPILDFYREFRIALVRSELSAGKPDKKLRHAELSRWAFLYNLDRYRGLPASAKADRVLSFETGSQREQSAGKGLILNGLDPRQEYKVFCYVSAPKD